jgi:hypothetical protein
MSIDPAIDPNIDPNNAVALHAAFFAGNDGAITLRSTARALMRLGYDRVSAVVMTPPMLVPFWGPRRFGGQASLRLDPERLPVRDAAAGHFTDTGAFAVDRAFDASRFGKLFDVYAGGGLFLYETDIARLVDGRLISAAEFTTLMQFACEIDRAGRKTLRRARMQAFYQGGLLADVADEVKRVRGGLLYPEPTGPGSELIDVAKTTADRARIKRVTELSAAVLFALWPHVGGTGARVGTKQ